MRVKVSSAIRIVLLALLFFLALSCGGKQVQNELILVPEGTAVIGADKEEIERYVKESEKIRVRPHDFRDETPQHMIKVGSFHLDKYEVTNAHYREFLEYVTRTNDHSKCHWAEGKNKKHTPSFWSNADYNQDDQPVVGVDWYDAYAYATWAGKRLPTEVEFERAARGDDSRIYPWGDKWSNKRDNFAGKGDDYKYASPVDEFSSGRSPYGCYGLAGNVSEWTSSLYAAYPYEVTDGRENQFQAGDRVVRGGSYTDYLPHEPRCSRRAGFAPTYRWFNIGFRCAKTPSPASPPQ